MQKKTLIYAHTNSFTLPTWDTNLGSPTLTCARSWRLCGITLAIRSSAYILNAEKDPDLRAHEFAHSPDLGHQPRIANFNLRPKLETLWNYSCYT